MIKIHNIMEEFVIDCVNRLYDQVKEKGSTWLSCDCENCRTDTATYVLNRIQPRYVVGGRGLTHNARTLENDIQISVDVEKLCVEGMHLVSNAKRPTHQSSSAVRSNSENSEFNFPTLTGNVFDGTSFEPLSDATVTLKLNGETVEMMDATWPNPCKTFKSTNGAYSFWMAPIVAVSDGMKKKFNFSVEVVKEGYEKATYSFVIPLVSEKPDTQSLDSTYSIKIQDIFLFKPEEQ